MKASRYSTSRQKACQSCSDAKAKCDRKAGTCGRCALRGVVCTYPSQASLVEMPSPVSMSGSYSADRPAFVPEAGVEADVAGTVNGRVRNSPSKGRNRDALDFTSLDLVCPINAEDIRNRWLNPYLPLPGQALKALPTSVTAFTYRVLKSYAAIAVRGRGIPPFLHQVQTSQAPLSPPLSACLSLLRVCESPVPGSEGVATDVLQREMTRLHEQHASYDDTALLAAFQAYLLYALALYFRLGRDADPFLRQAVMNLQEIACACSARGLVCLAEQQGARPRWEAWIVAEAKRRTLFTMYLLDNVLSVKDGLPTFLGTELRGLPAPASKSLWQASSRDEWEKAYNSFLAEWPDGGLRIDELWPVPADLGETDRVKRCSRVDQWLEDVDEYGTMMYAVTSCTHGG